MIDPTKFTDFNLSPERLEEYILFCIAVAGKNATTTAANLERLLQHLRKICDTKQPFDSIRSIDELELASLMKRLGFGCYNLKARGFSWMSRSGLNLQTCSVEDLERCPGVGPKTSRFFVMHTRSDVEMACLDTHILKWLRRRGHDVPKQSPQSRKRYGEVEAIFLQECRKRKMGVAEMDLAIWNSERNGKDY